MRSLLEGKRILLVEDSEMLQKAQSQIVEDLGCLVDTAGNSHQALDLLSKKHFDAILTDVALPDISGAELINLLRKRELRDSRKPIPMIAITAYASDEIIEECLGVGANIVLKKPLVGEILKIYLENYLIKV